MMKRGPKEICYSMAEKNIRYIKEIFRINASREKEDAEIGYLSIAEKACMHKGMR